MSAHAESAPGAEEPSETVLAVVSAHGEQEVLLVEREGRRLCRVRATSREEKARLPEIGRLLLALEDEGVRAVPRVIGRDSAGLLLERHAPLRLGGGRRRAQPGEATPPTLERRALLGAREDLEALVGALHARGWVVGLAPGAGLGARADGTVVIADLRTLQREGSVGSRMQDQHWLDSVLEDQGRTLRRRVDLLPAEPVASSRAPRSSPAPAACPVPGLSPGPVDVPVSAVAGGLAPFPPAADSSAPADVPGLPPPPAWSEGWRARLARGEGSTEALGSDEGILGPEDSDGPRRRPSPVTSRRMRPPRGRNASTRHRSSRRLAPPRGILLAAAATVLVLGGGAAAIGAALVHHERPAPSGSTTAPAAAPGSAGSDASSSDSSGSTGTTDSSDSSGPQSGAAVDSNDARDGSVVDSTGIEDPRALVQALALGRHRYVTGRAESTVCAPGSPAAAQDEALREAYRDVEVQGEGPVVTNAQVEQLDEQGGTARVRASLDQGALRLTTSDGAVVLRPAEGEQEVVLELVREDGAWRVSTAGPLEA